MGAFWYTYSMKTLKEQEDDVGVMPMQDKTFAVMALVSLLTLGILYAIGRFVFEAVYSTIAWFFNW
jgi:hypothetical protein